MAQPLVSVTIPVFNAKHTILETLESVLAQTYQEIEILIVDDGSTDDTLEIMQAFAADKPQIKILTQKNAGVAAARNTAIAAAKGKYIAPIDADDLWHTQRLELHIKALEEADEKTAVAYSPFYVLNTKSEICGQSTRLDISGEVFEKQLQQNLVGNGSGITVRTEALREVGGYSSHLLHMDAQGCEDFLVQMMLADKYQYVCVPYYLIGYRVYDGNMSSNVVKMIKSRLYAFEHLRQHCHPDPKSLRKMKLRFLADLAFTLRHKKGLRAIFKEVPPFINSFTEGVEFICIMLPSVLSRLKNRGKRLIGFKDTPVTKASNHTKQMFQKIAVLPPQ